MNLSVTRRNLITQFCCKILDEQKSAMLAMTIDMATSMSESKEELVLFNQQHCGIIGVSYIDKKLRFIDDKGNSTLAEDYKEAYFDLFCCVWNAFHTDIETEQ